MLKSGRSRAYILGHWLAVMGVAAVSGAIGFALFDNLPPESVALTEAFAAGALLTMVLDTMVPEARRDAHLAAGLAGVAGFAFSFYLGTL
jgi:ZIP family zinc transporter